MSPPRRAWLISSALTVAALVVVELGFRVAGCPVSNPEDVITELDAHRLVRNRAGLSIRAFPGQVPVTTNRFGFRGRETTVEKPAGVYRIVTLGDSCTFGASVGDDDTFCAQLERLLNANARSGQIRYEVINAGVIGYATVQGLRTLNSLVLPFKPDCLIVSFALNDASQAGANLGYLGRRLSEIGDASPVLVWGRNLLWNHSWACRWFLRDAMYRFRASAYGRYYQRAMEGGWKQVSPDEYRRNLAEFARIARANSAGIVFLPMPVRLKHTLFPLYQGNWLVVNDGAYREALRRMERAIARATGPADRSAMRFYEAQLRESRRDLRGALDAYMRAMEDSDRTRDLRWEGYRYATLMAETAAQENVPLPNVLPAFYMRELTDDPRDLWADGYHPGPLGHRIIAEALHPVIADLAGRRAGSRAGRLGGL